MLDAWLAEAGFQLRNRFLGKLPLRASAPRPEEGPAREAEHEFYQSVIETLLPDPEVRASIRRVTDVGCRNWSYVRALAESFPRAELLGVELDQGRRLANLHRRGDYARAYVRQVGRARCVFGDYLEVQANEAASDLTTFFFPFVSESPCLAWGLPPRYADFRAMLAHAARLTRGSRSCILSLHQGEWEYRLAKNAYMTLQVSVREKKFSMESFPELWPGRFDVYGILAEIPNALRHSLSELESP